MEWLLWLLLLGWAVGLFDFTVGIWCLKFEVHKVKNVI